MHGSHSHERRRPRLGDHRLRRSATPVSDILISATLLSGTPVSPRPATSPSPIRRAGAVLAAVGLTVLTLTSCAGDPGPMGVDDPDDQPASAPAATHPDDGADPHGGSPNVGAGLDGDVPDIIPTPVQETQELVSEHLSSWQEHSTPSETELQLAFYSGNPACYGVRSVVEKDDDEVRVATISGTLPDAVGTACTQEARYVSLVIELEEPLGEREVLPLAEVDLAP